MLTTLGEKSHEPAADRIDVPIRPRREEAAQRSPIRGPPILIEIQDQRDPPMTAAARLIDMAAVSRTCRIPRVVQLEIE
jgi:hypothetical protein